MGVLESPKNRELERSFKKKLLLIHIYSESLPEQVSVFPCLHPNEVIHSKSMYKRKINSIRQADHEIETNLIRAHRRLLYLARMSQMYCVSPTWDERPGANGADSVGDSGVGTAQMRQENSHSRQFRDWKSPQRATGRESHAIGTQVKNATFGRGIRAARCASAREDRGATGTEIESGRGGIISGALRRTGTPCQGVSKYSPGIATDHETSWRTSAYSTSCRPLGRYSHRVPTARGRIELAAKEKEQEQQSRPSSPAFGPVSFIRRRRSPCELKQRGNSWRKGQGRARRRWGRDRERARRKSKAAAALSLPSERGMESAGARPIVGETELMLYDGTFDWDDYCAHVDVVANVNGWNSNTKGHRASCALRGVALSVFSSLDSENRTEWNTLSTALSKRFGQKHLAMKWQIELESRYQRPQESTSDLAYDIERLCRFAFPDLPRNCKDQIGVRIFLRALSNDQLRRLLAVSVPSSIQDALHQALVIEATLGHSDLVEQADSTGDSSCTSITKYRHAVCSSRTTGSALFVQLQLNTTPCFLLIDTGATVSVVRPDVARKSGAEISTAHHAMLRTVHGELIEALGSARINVRLGERHIMHSFVVAEIFDEAILGLDLLNILGACLDLRSHRMLINSDIFPLLSFGTCPQVKNIECASDFEWIQRALDSSELINGSEEYKKVFSLFQKHARVFAASGKPLGRTHVVKHAIETGDARPIKQAPRRVPYAQEAQIDKLMQEMIEQDVIEPSKSPWASPVVLIPKKDGTIRFCVDYRKVNQVTKKDSYTLPCVQELLDTLGGAQWFCTIDLKCGYWQIGLSEESKEKTAFSLYRKDCDASAHTVGAVLSQRQSDQEVAIAYFSSTLSRPEQNYCATRRELLAVVRSISHFHQYLFGRHFTLRTDHAALTWLTNFKRPEGQLARWLETLQQYDFTIKHRAGSKHANADGLSRRPCEVGCGYCCRREKEDTLKIAAISLQSEASVDEQMLDPSIQKVINHKVNGVKPSLADLTAADNRVRQLVNRWESLEVHNNQLYHRWDGPTNRLQWVVPLSRMKSVLETCHDNPVGGHFGFFKTLAKVRQSYFWPGMTSDVRSWCKTCLSCRSFKGPKKKITAPLQQVAVGSPFDRIGMDILGPFPKTRRGNRYILVAADYFTKWPEAIAIPDQEAKTVAIALIENVLSRVGIPLEIHTDQGRNFESTLVRELAQLMGIVKTRSTSLHPQSGGLVERLNRTLTKHLAQFVDRSQSNWDEKLPLFLLAYRSACHSTTGLSPAQLVYGRDLRLPEILVRPPVQEVRPTTEYVIQLREHLQQVRDFAAKEAGMGIHSKYPCIRSPQLAVRSLIYETQCELDGKTLEIYENSESVVSQSSSFKQLKRFQNLFVFPVEQQMSLIPSNRQLTVRLRSTRYNERNEMLQKTGKIRIFWCFGTSQEGNVFTLLSSDLRGASPLVPRLLTIEAYDERTGSADRQQKTDDSDLKTNTTFAHGRRRNGPSSFGILVPEESFIFPRVSLPGVESESAIKIFCPSAVRRTPSAVRRPPYAVRRTPYAVRRPGIITKFSEVNHNRAAGLNSLALISVHQRYNSKSMNDGLSKLTARTCTLECVPVVAFPDSKFLTGQTVEVTTEKRFRRTSDPIPMDGLYSNCIYKISM
ncbi:unnamed protein product, partial [Nesidiocoris tenuis]